MVNPNKIELLNATLGYRNGPQTVEVLKSIDLHLQAGDFIAAVGYNGSGKSTLIKVLSGVMKPISGRIRMNGMEMESVSLVERAKNTALVLTEKIQGFNLSLFDLVAAGQMPYTNSFHQLESAHLAAIEQALDKTGLSEYRHKKLHELSDGLFQKAVIAKALAQKSPVMLLDEPTAYLDYGSKHRLFELLANLVKEEQKCILVSSHDLDLVGRYCNKILIVANSTCTLLDTKAAIHHPDFLAIGGNYL
jgi:iron complex transport system ATP-binding protein